LATAEEKGRQDAESWAIKLVKPLVKIKASAAGRTRFLFMV
jgi:hypothetical protein